jgi:hypothetical protein
LHSSILFTRRTFNALCSIDTLAPARAAPAFYKITRYSTLLMGRAQITTMSVVQMRSLIDKREIEMPKVRGGKRI